MGVFNEDGSLNKGGSSSSQSYTPGNIDWDSVYKSSLRTANRQKKGQQVKVGDFTYTNLGDGRYKSNTGQIRTKAMLDRLAQIESSSQEQQKQIKAGGITPGNVLKDIGSAAKTVGEGIFQAPITIGTGIGELAYDATGGNARDRQVLQGAQASDKKMFNALAQRWKNAKTEEERTKYRKAMLELSNQSDAEYNQYAQRTQQMIENIDPVRQAAAIAELGLDVATMGIGGNVLRAGKAVKTAATAGRAGRVASTLNQSKAAQLAENFVNPSTLRQGLVTGAITGGTYGATGTAQSLGGDATAVDYLKNTAIGAALGGTIGTFAGGAGVNITRKGFQKAGWKAAQDSGVVDYNFPISEATNLKINALAKEAAATPLKEGHTRLYQTFDVSGQRSDQYFSRIENLRSYINGQSDNKVVDFVDVPNSRVKQAANSEYVFEVAPPKSPKQVKVERAVEENLRDVDNSYRAVAERALKAKEGQKTSMLKRAWETATTQIYNKNSQLVREDRFAAKLEGKSLDKLRANGQSLTDKAVKLRTINSGVELALKSETSDGWSVAKMMQRDGASDKVTSKATETNGFLNDLYDLRVRGVIDNDYKVVNKETGKSLGQDSTEVIQQRVADYISQHPEWKKDVRAVKKFMDDMLDIGVSSGSIKQGDAEFVKGYYGNIAVPVERVLSEDLIRPDISGGIRTSVGKDRILQSLEGGSQPLSMDYSRFTTRAQAAISQSVKQEIDNELLRRYRNGSLREGGELVIDPEKLQDVEAFNKIRSEIFDEVKTLKKEIAKERTRLRNAKTGTKVQSARAKGVKNTEVAKVRGRENLEALKIKQLESRASQRTRDYLSKVVGTRRKSAMTDETTALEMQLVDAINQMPDNEVVKIFYAMSGDGKLNTGAAEGIAKTTGVNSIETVKRTLNKAFNRISKQQVAADQRIAKATGALQSKQEAVDAISGRIGEMLDYRRQLQDTNSALFKQLREEAQSGTPAGLNTISGLEDGYKFVIKTGPEISRALERLGKGKIDQALKVLNVPTAIKKALWTANPVLAPVFKVSEAVYNPMLMALTTKARIRDLVNPATIREAMSKEFGEELRKRGALREGALESARQSETSARLIAAQGKEGLKNVPGLILKDPKAAASKLSEVVKFYQNGLRRWSAAGTKRRFMKQYQDDGLATNVAVHDYNNVLGNFAEATDAARAVEAFLPYTVAGQAGVRQFAKAIRERPLETTSRIAVFLAGAGLVASKFMSTPEGREYVKENYDNDRALNVDGYLIIGTPQKQVDDEGNVTWTGITKIPIPPDARPLTGLINRGLIDGIEGSEHLTDEMIFSSLEGLVTGGLGIDSSTGKFDIVDSLYGGPVGDTAIIAGYNPEYGQELPTAGDRVGALLSRGGTTGKAIKEGDIGAYGEGIKNKFVQTKGASIESQAYRQVYDNIGDSQSFSKELDSRKITSTNDARRLAEERNAKIDRVIEMIRNSSMGQSAKDELISNIERQKASTKEHALKRRLGIE